MRVRAGISRRKSRTPALAAALCLAAAVGCGSGPTQPEHASLDARRGAPLAGGERALGAADAGAASSKAGAPRDADAGSLPTCKLAQGPLLGAVSDRSIKVWAAASDAGKLSVAIWRADAPNSDGAERKVTGETFRAETDFTAIARVDGLEPEMAYGYRVYIDGRPCSQDFTFSTLGAAGKPGRVRFVTAGDVHGGKIPGFDDIAKVSPDFVVMLGDNVYADERAARAVYQKHYRKVFGGAQLTALFARTAGFATWDDHELVDNYWNGKNDAVYAFARPLYEHYQASRNPDPLAAGELYYRFEAGNVGFFVLDTRSHRSRNRDRDGPEKSMLGGPQKAALLAWLVNDRYRVHVIVSSVLMSDQSTTGSDSWRGFKTEREEILRAIAAHGTSNAIVVSGDQHWSAILKLERGAKDPYAIYEFQTTPLGFEERVAPSRRDASVLALDNTHRVFGVFDIDTTQEPPTLDFTLCAVGSPCTPHDEPAPAGRQRRTRVPYSVHFFGGERGLRLTTPK